MADRPIFLYAAIYDDLATAEADYEAVFELHAAGAIGTFDSAVIYKDDEGKVHVSKTEKPTQHGAWTGCRRWSAGRAPVPARADRQRGRRRRRRRADRTPARRRLAGRPQGSRRGARAGQRRGDRARRVKGRGTARRRR